MPNVTALTADQYLQRLIQVFPGPWAGEAAYQPGGNLYAILYMFATVLAETNDQLAYVDLQKRIATATDTNLEAIANDFFGPGYTRSLILAPSGTYLIPETDAVFSQRIRTDIVAPKNTLAAIAAKVNEYLQTYYTAEVVGEQNLLGLDTAGGVDTIGALDGRPNDLPRIPIATAFDLQSNPTLAATVGLTTSQFCILLTYGGLVKEGWFLGQSYLGQNTYIINPSIQVISPPTDELDAVVEAAKAYGFQQVYADDRGA